MGELRIEGRPSLHPLQTIERRSSRRTIVESKRLYGFEISDAALERTDWTFPTADLMRYTSLDADNYREFITTTQDQDGSAYYSQHDRTYLNLLYKRWDKSLLDNGSFKTTKFPVLPEIRALAQEQGWVVDEYENLWHNDSGGSAVMTEDEKSGFILQTPNDGGPFCSLVISEYQPNNSKVSSCGGLYIADKEYDLDELLQTYSLPVSLGNSDSVCRFHAMSMVLPMKIFRTHTEATRKQLEDLAKLITQTELRIASGQVDENTEKDNKSLNSMNLHHMRIHRRWNFERELGASILQYFDIAVARENGKRKDTLKAIIKPMRSQVERQARYSLALKYDMDTIPKRIRNQSKAIFNLMIQRDNQLNLAITELNTEIATSSAKIAEESRRDSASMKTIAVLTLVFLPGAFVASIFSMSMFNFNPDAGKPITSGYLWLYFAITIPLTLVILVGWLVFYYKFQRPKTQRNKDIEVQLPPSVRAMTFHVKGEKFV